MHITQGTMLDNDRMVVAIVTVSDVVDAFANAGIDISEDEARERMQAHSRHLVDGFVNGWEDVVLAALED